MASSAPPGEARRRHCAGAAMAAEAAAAAVREQAEVVRRLKQDEADPERVRRGPRRLRGAGAVWGGRGGRRCYRDQAAVTPGSPLLPSADREGGGEAAGDEGAARGRGGEAQVRAEDPEGNGPQPARFASPCVGPPRVGTAPPRPVGAEHGRAAPTGAVLSPFLLPAVRRWEKGDQNDPGSTKPPHPANQTLCSASLRSQPPAGRISFGQSYS